MHETFFVGGAFVVDPSGSVPEGTTTKDSILPRYGVSTGPATHELLDAIYRLLRLLSTPSDISIFPLSEKRSEFVLKPLDFDF